MWKARTYKLDQYNGIRVEIEEDGDRLSYARASRNWRVDERFRHFFVDLLARAHFDAFRWETPPVTRDTLDRAFTFVLLDAPELKRTADPSDFAEHFEQARPGSVLEFSNLGGDAWLVVPAPAEGVNAPAHLATFSRNAPAEQQHALWQQVGAALERRVGERPVWLSTAGAGVPWLHLRLDDRPKYYGYQPWRRMSLSSSCR